MILARIRATVVLPAPLSPTIAVTLPASSASETLSTACTGARRANGPRPCLIQKYLVRLRPSSTGAVTALIATPPSWARADRARPAPPHHPDGASKRPPAAPPSPSATPPHKRGGAEAPPHCSGAAPTRSEERRVGKEGRSRWS